MNAQPKRWYDGTLMMAYGMGHGQVYIECELTSPPSMAGRPVHLLLTAEDAVNVMKLCKDAAIAARQKPLDP